MKVKELIKKLLDSNMNAEVLVSFGDTFDDVSDFTLSWGGPNSADGNKIEDEEFVYIDFLNRCEKYEDTSHLNCTTQEFPSELKEALEQLKS